MNNKINIKKLINEYYKRKYDICLTKIIEEIDNPITYKRIINNEYGLIGNILFNNRELIDEYKDYILEK